MADDDSTTPASIYDSTHTPDPAPKGRLARIFTPANIAIVLLLIIFGVIVTFLLGSSGNNNNVFIYDLF